MNEKKLIFVYNPHAGKGAVRSSLSDILDIFVKNGYTVTVYPTQGRGDAREKTPQFVKEYSYLVCCGGDGTLDEVINGMLTGGDARIPIGYIPAGSTNDFAYSLRIPSKDMLKAAQIAMTGESFSCDIGRFNDDYFVYVAAFGLFSDVSYSTSQKKKNTLGHLAYIFEGAKQLTDIPSFTMRVVADGKTFAGNYMYGMISNSLSVGGMTNLVGEDILLDDGLHEVTLIQMPTNPVMFGDLAASFLMPKVMDPRYITRVKAKHIEIYSDETVPWTLDGEYGGSHKEVVIDNLGHQAVFTVAPEEGYEAEELEPYNLFEGETYEREP